MQPPWQGWRPPPPPPPRLRAAAETPRLAPVVPRLVPVVPQRPSATGASGDDAKRFRVEPPASLLEHGHGREHGHEQGQEHEREHGHGHEHGTWA